MVAGKGTFQGGEGTRAEVSVDEDLMEVGWSDEIDSGECFKEIVWPEFWEEDVETFMEDVIEYQDARIVGGDKGLVLGS